ncbi:hypothetical protein PSAB6_510049 [Paraburkholderia sabiae]|nr:hypothetical protein PSAB6_510049 [Paraburkholderia sabiae]
MLTHPKLNSTPRNKSQNAEITARFVEEKDYSSDASTRALPVGSAIRKQPVTANTRVRAKGEA